MYQIRESMFSCFLALLFFVPVVTNAQQNHYVYIQSEGKQPFYIKYKNKIYSSSAAGYLILSKLNEADLNIQLGFAEKNTPEITFQISLESTDRGYLLKEFPEKGWGLYDLQRYSVVYAQTTTGALSSQTKPAPQTEPVNDPFANMLSQVTQDSTVKQVTVKQPEPPRPDSSKKTEVTPGTTVVTKEKKDTLVVIPTVAAPQVIKTDSSQTEVQWQAPAKAKIRLLNKYESREGVDYSFEVTELTGVPDTIKFFIAQDTNRVVPVSVVVDTPAPVKVQDTVQRIAEVKTEVLPEKKENAVIKEKPVEPVAPVQAPPVPVSTQPASESAGKSVPNSNCKAVATEDDFLKLRRKMAQQNKEEQMVAEAKKAFRTMCFTSNQLKNLAVLFLTDEWRYRFYDAAFPFVTDFQNFRSLESTLNDEYYKKRFLALIPTN